jgi:TRAP-type C4-dicarboxylate transport system substrate-binding protein
MIATRILAATAFALALAGVAHAQDKPVQLKLSHWVPPQHPLQAAIQDWADDVKKESGGTITSAIFPSEQLGKAFDHYDMARDGIADEWYRQYAAKEMKDVHFCFAFVNDISTIHSRVKIVLPTDIKGLKMRPADATMGAFTTLLGGSNVQASAPGSRDLLERGVADGIFFPWGSTVLFGIDKVTKYHLEAPLYVTTFVWVMNQHRYDTMSANQKKAIDDHCTTDWAVRFASPWVDFEHAGIEKIRAEPGAVLTPLTPDQLQQWKTVAQPLQQQWADSAKKAGVDPDAAFKGLQAELAKWKAGY